MSEVIENQLMQAYYAMFRGAYESGVSECSLGSKFFSHLSLPKYEEMQINNFSDDKTALSYAFGVALSGKRTLCFIQDIPFNLVSQYSYTGVNGALVVVYLEDNSFVEYDSRPFFKTCNYPIFEPSDAKELKKFVKISFNFSEKYDVPVIIRVSRNLLNSFSDVPIVAKKDIKDKPYKKDASKYVLLPSTIKLCAEDIVERNRRLVADVGSFPVNVETRLDNKIGVIASGEIAQMVKESMPQASLLALGISNPLPMEKIKAFAESVGELYVIEEHPFIETALIKEGIKCKGEVLFPREGRRTVADIASWITGETAPQTETRYGIRTPEFCNDCGLVPVAFSLKKFGLPVFTDIGCGILSGCFMSANEVGISCSIVSALAFSKTQKCISFLLENEFIEQLTALQKLDLSNICIVVAVDNDNFKKYIPLINGECAEISVEDFSKLESVDSKVYFVKVEKVCKYEV